MGQLGKPNRHSIGRLAIGRQLNSIRHNATCLRKPISSRTNSRKVGKANNSRSTPQHHVLGLPLAKKQKRNGAAGQKEHSHANANTKHCPTTRKCPFAAWPSPLSRNSKRLSKSLGDAWEKKTQRNDTSKAACSCDDKKRISWYIITLLHLCVASRAFARELVVA